MRDGRFAHLNDAEKLPYITENETRSEVNEMRREEGGTEFLEYIDVDTVFTEAGKDSRNKTFPTKESDSLDTYGAAFCKNHSISEYCRSFENSVPQLLRESQEIMRQNPKRNEVLQIQLSKSEFKGTDFEKFCTGNKEIPQMLVCNQVRNLRQHRIYIRQKQSWQNRIREPHTRWNDSIRWQYLYTVSIQVASLLLLPCRMAGLFFITGSQEN